MNKLIIKQWQNGQFKTVKEIELSNNIQIRHHNDGLEVVAEGHIQVYDNQCVIEFV